jgi:uncharacterized membrane protein YagU involved in acid resistance
VVHWAVGVASGAVYGALVRRAPGAGLAGGALFGLGVWALAFGVMAPALRITPSPRRTAWPANAVNVAAHLVYGVCTAVVTAELGRQAQAPGVARRWLRARVG